MAGPITSAGTKLTKRGPVQTVVLTDPNTGLPISVVEELDGSLRLAVDANISVEQIVVDIRPLTLSEDAVAIGNKASGNLLAVNPDGSINVDVVLDSLGDSVSIGDATTGDKMVVNPDGTINTIQKNAAVDVEWDDAILAYDLAFNLTSVAYKLAGNPVRTLTLSYDAFGNITEVAKS